MALLFPGNQRTYEQTVDLASTHTVKQNIYGRWWQFKRTTL